jgi:hypothetical protein
VPSEKTTGMRRFWERNTRKIATDGLGNPSVVRDELSRLLGVPKVSATKTASDVFMRLRHRSDLAVGAVRRRPTIQG